MGDESSDSELSEDTYWAIFGEAPPPKNAPKSDVANLEEVEVEADEIFVSTSDALDVKKTSVSTKKSSDNPVGGIRKQTSKIKDKLKESSQKLLGNLRRSSTEPRTKEPVVIVDDPKSRKTISNEPSLITVKERSNMDAIAREVSFVIPVQEDGIKEETIQTDLSLIQKEKAQSASKQESFKEETVKKRSNINPIAREDSLVIPVQEDGIREETIQTDLTLIQKEKAQRASKQEGVKEEMTQTFKGPTKDRGSHDKHYPSPVDVSRSPRSSTKQRISSSLEIYSTDSIQPLTSEETISTYDGSCYCPCCMKQKIKKSCKRSCGENTKCGNYQCRFYEGNNLSEEYMGAGVKLRYFSGIQNTTCCKNVQTSIQRMRKIHCRPYCSESINCTCNICTKQYNEDSSTNSWNGRKSFASKDECHKPKNYNLVDSLSRMLNNRLTVRDVVNKFEKQNKVLNSSDLNHAKRKPLSYNECCGNSPIICSCCNKPKLQRL